MAKKIFIIIAILVLVFSAIGCSAQSSESAMQMAPAQLTEQESQILNLIQGDKPGAIFDYTINHNVKSVSIACYKLDEDGKWIVNGESSYPVSETSGRLALSFENLGDGFRVAVQESDNMTAGENKSVEKIDTKGMGSATSYASAESIEYEKEIPLAIQVFTSKNEFSSCGVEYFNNPEEYQKRGYEEVYVVTIRFSKNELK